MIEKNKNITSNKVIILGIVPLINSDKVHQNQELYDPGGIIGTIKSTHYKSPPQGTCN